MKRVRFSHNSDSNQKHQKLIDQGYLKRATRIAHEKLTYCMDASEKARQELECAFKHIILEECYIGRQFDDTQKDWYIVIPSMASPPHEWTDSNLCFHFSPPWNICFDDLLTNADFEGIELVREHGKQLLIMFLSELHHEMSKHFEGLVPLHEIIEQIKRN